MTQNARLGLSTWILLLPALALVTAGVLHLEPPTSLVQPVLVIAGLLLAITINAAVAMRVRLKREGEYLAGTIFLRVHGCGMNVVALTAAVVLFLTVVGYVVVENTGIR